MSAEDTVISHSRLPGAGAVAAGVRHVDVDGLPFVACSLEVLSSHISAHAAAGRGGWVVTPNIDILRRWRSDASFRELVSEATFFTPDGLPIVWASRLQGTPLPGRLAGSDLFVDLYMRAVASGLRIALIGGNPGAAEAAVLALADGKYPSPDLVRTLCPPLGFENIPEQMMAIESLIREWRPHVVFVGLGSPKQEKLIDWARRVRPDSWYLGVGVSFSFMAGDVKRAPVWAQGAGLEWAYRLMQEPSRLARRYLVDGMPFAVGLAFRSIARRVRS